MTEAREKWKVNRRDAKKIKKYKKGRALCVHLGFVPHHIFRTDLFFEPGQR
jgi:hypothetical protein